MSTCGGSPPAVTPALPSALEAESWRDGLLWRTVICARHFSSHSARDFLPNTCHHDPPHFSIDAVPDCHPFRKPILGGSLSRTPVGAPLQPTHANTLPSLHFPTSLAPTGQVTLPGLFPTSSLSLQDILPRFVPCTATRVRVHCQEPHFPVLLAKAWEPNGGACSRGSSARSTDPPPPHTHTYTSLWVHPSLGYEQNRPIIT